ncbi:MAG TPA: hypothetical protein DCQ98_02800 [Planctomycetaceae bacterium]|nr:hypothetical protein [Planctomycetaceae bacterium]
MMSVSSQIARAAPSSSAWRSAAGLSAQASSSGVYWNEKRPQPSRTSREASRQSSSSATAACDSGSGSMTQTTSRQSGCQWRNERLSDRAPARQLLVTTVTTVVARFPSMARP